MKAKHNTFTKALSVVLTAVMLLCTVSVGFILPETRLTASAATYTANSVDSLNAAIANANSAGADTQTTIQLTGNISVNGDTAATTAITGNVLFDFAGYSMTFEKTVNVSENTNDDYRAQLPSELQSSGGAKDYVTKGILNVASGGTLQLVNTSGTASTLKVWTKIDCDDGSGSFFWSRDNKTTHTATSSIIYSEGTVIIGDKTNSANNNFTLWAQAISNDDEEGYIRRSPCTNSYCVTVNSSSAVLKMYGGTLDALSCGRGNYNGDHNHRCYPINIYNAYSAEIYGGTIAIPSDDENGLRNSDGNAPGDSGNSYYANIRTRISNTFIFNASLSLDITVGSDTGKSHVYTANVLADNSAQPLIYGGSLSNRSNSRRSGNDGYFYAYTVMGAWRLAIDGNRNPGGAFATDTGKVSITKQSEKTLTSNIFTIFYIGDRFSNSTTAFENSTYNDGVYPWSYATYRDYLAALNSSNDLYYGNTGTHIGDGTNYSAETAYNYRRPGYVQNGWYGSFNVGVEDGSVTTGALAGTLFLYPKWQKNNYTVTFDFNDSSYSDASHNYADSVSKVTGFNNTKTYNIENTNVTPGTPTRAGYTFKGWTVTAVSYPEKDAYNGTTPWFIGAPAASDKVLGGGAAGSGLGGNYGDITLKANWEINEYDISYDTTGCAETVYGSTYTVEDQAQLTNDDVTKNFYDFAGQWKVKSTDNAASWTVGNAFNGATIFNRGLYGNVTFEPVFTPHNYNVYYNMDGGNAIEDDSVKTYNIESTHSLPSATKEGWNFVGWTPVEGAGAWVSGETYIAGTSFGGKYGDVTLKAVWSVETFTVSFDVKSDESFGTSSFNYVYNQPYTLSTAPLKTGYKFTGWKVKSTSTGGTWPVGTVYAPDAVTGAVTIPANMRGDAVLEATWAPVSYTITYNTNGGVAVAEMTYDVDDTVVLASTTKNGYSFVNWQVSGATTGNWSGTFNAGAVLTGKYGEVTLLANWAPVDYTVTLDTNGGSLGSTPATMTYTIESDEPERRLPVPTKTGYEFSAWEVDSYAGSWDAVGSYTDYLPVGRYGNVTLKAKWTPVSYSIRFNGTSVSDKSYTIEDAAFTLPSTSSDGYSFDGWKVTTAAGNWNLNDVYEITDSISGKYGNIVVEPVFTPIEYTLTYSYPDGTSSSETYDITKAVELDSSYTCGGYIFGGWQPSECVGGNWPSDGVFNGILEAGKYGDVTLVPVLTPDTFVISFDSAGGTAYANRNYTIADDTALPQPVKTGYDFAGWKVTAAGGNWTANTVLPVDATVNGRYGNVTLTATWTARKYTVTWVTGSGSVDSSVDFGTTPVYTGSTYKAPDAEFTYTFNGWDPAIVPVSGDATYTAKYTATKRKYTVTWVTDINETESTTSSAAYEYGTTPVYNNGVNPVKESTDPADHVWRFTGWSPELAAVTGDVTYTAQFVRVAAPRTVTWIIDGVRNDTYYEVGETPAYSGTPYKAPADGYEYIFTSWTPAIVTVAANMDYEYTAQFTAAPKKYVATFDAAGGVLYEDEIEYDLEDGIRMPAPTKSGYRFTGWTVTVAGGTWVKDTVYAAGDAVLGKWGSVKLIAGWELADYTVTFNCTEGTAPAALTYTIESTATLPACERTGYEMTAYTVTTAAGSWTLGTSVSAGEALTGKYGDVTLTPVWYPKAYTITWISGATEQTTEVLYGSVIGGFEPIAKAGYTAEWDAEIPEKMPASDLTFTAVYTLIDYNVRVVVNGGEPIDNFTYNIETDKVLPTPVRAGSEFDGWRVTIAGGNWVKNDLLPAGAALKGKYGNVTVSAEWTLETHKVTFVAGDVTKETLWYHGSVPFYNGTPYKSSDEYNSYVFAGWDKDFTEVIGDVTYTALFTPVERIYTVTWNVDGATIPQTYAYGDLPVYPGGIPSKESTSEYDFEFMGWDKTVEPVTKDVTYIAEWDIFTKLRGLSLDASAVFLAPDGTAQLNANIYPATASVKDVKWTSLDASVVTVDAQGKLTAVNPGVTLVKVASVDGAFNSYCYVSVEGIHTTYVTISTAGVSTTNLPGSSVQLSATVMPDNATDVTTKWSSSDPSVASVDENGLVTYNRTGTAVITCNANDGYALGTIEVRVTQNSSEVKDEVKTHVVIFVETDSDYVIDGVAYPNMSLIVPEGKTVEFKTAKPTFVLLDGTVMLKDDDGYYRIKDVAKNYNVLTSPNEYDLPEDEELPETIQEIEHKATFFERLQAFFKMIVDFFRNLFK